MTNSDIATLVNSNVMAVTSHSLSVPDAYQLSKFKSQVSKVFKEWSDKNDALLKEVGIDDAIKFDQRLDELNKKDPTSLTAEESKELLDLKELLNRLNGLRSKLGEEEVTIEVKPLSYETWFKLKEENKDLKVSNVELLEVIETLLENVLWVAPTE